MNFFCKLLPPRASFAQDMTEAEAQLMQQHAAYWQEWMRKGHIVTFGLVADPAGAYGIGVVDFAGEDEVHAFTSGDPTIQAQRGFRFEVLPMPFGAVRS